MLSQCLCKGLNLFGPQFPPGIGYEHGMNQS